MSGTHHIDQQVQGSHPVVNGQTVINGSANPLAVARSSESMAGPTYSSGPTSGHDSVGIFSPLHTLRRRWPHMLVAGTVGALIFASAAWVVFQPKFRTYATLQVHSEAPRLAFEIDEAEQAAQFEVYKKTQKELVLGDAVLWAALRDKELAGSKQVQAIAKVQDPVIWLRSQLRVDFPGNAEIMSIAMDGDNAAFITKAVNAVLDAYVENVVEVGKTNRSERLTELRKVLGDQEERARRLRSQLQSLAEDSGSGDVDALSAKQHAAIERFAQLQSEYARVQFERLGQELKVSRLADQIKAQENMGIAPVEHQDEKSADASGTGTTHSSAAASVGSAVGLEAEVLRDTAVAAQQEVVRKAVLAMEEKQRRIGPNQSGVLAKWRENVEQEQQYLEKLKDVARQDVSHKLAQQALLARQAETNQLKKDHEALKSEVQMLQLHEKMLLDSLEKATADANKIGTNSVNIELTRKELERLESINGKIGLEKETLTIELRSASRVEELGRARQPQSASKEERLKKAAAFAVLGFLLPCAGLFWLDTRRKHVNGEAELLQLSALRLLGSVPMVPRGNFQLQNREHSVLALREAIDRIRTVLIREAELAEYRVIQITSAVSGEAKTTFSGQLAKSLARAHRRTVLIDFDLRCPSVHQIFGTSLESGACELLRGELRIEDVLRPTDEENLWIIHAGHCDRLALSALTKDVVGELTSRLRESFEFVIIDSSPVLPVVDALLVAQRSDATILTALRDVTRAPQLAETVERLRQVGANVIGSVVTTSGYHSYYSSMDRYAVHSA